MKKIINLNFFFILCVSIFTACIDVTIPAADATFSIMKDTIIDGKKSRVEVTEVDTIKPVYFVYNGVSKLNAVWPGDKFKATAAIVTLDTTTVAGKIVIKKKTTVVNYYVSQDYNSRKDSVILSVLAKKDTSFTQLAPIYQGVALPFGTSELQYTFKSKGNLVVTWIARNANGKDRSEEIKQKTIRVK